MALDKAAVFTLRTEFPPLQQTVNGRPIIFFDGPGGTQVHGSVIEALGHYLTQANSNAVPGTGPAHEPAGREAGTGTGATQGRESAEVSSEPRA